MKNLILFLLAIFTINSCSKSSEYRAKKLIEEDLKNTLNDFKSYEPVKFGTLIDAESNLEDDTEIRTLLDKNDKLKDEREKYLSYTKQLSGNYIASAVALKNEYYNKYDSITEIIKLNLKKADSIYKNFQPKVIGKQMSHTYRAKNAYGAKTLGVTTYVFDKDVKRIIRQYNADAK